jgi:ABC-2 type transport system permease protein
MRQLSNIFWLGLKELRALRHDPVLIGLLLYAFTLSIYVQASAISHELHNGSIAIVDEDESALSKRIAESFFPPHFKPPVQIIADEIDRDMDRGRFMFVVDIPPDFERDVLAGRRPAVQVNIDATAVAQAGIGASYIANIITDEVTRYAAGPETSGLPVELVTRIEFNPNMTTAWFTSIMGLITMVNMLTIILTGAALIREREHGTIEHLLVMPLNPFEIVMAKVWANALIILLATGLSLFVVIRGLLGVPVGASIPLFLAGTALYLFFATALGVFLGTVARSMPQLGLLVILVVLPMNLLSGGDTPIESQPEWLQMITMGLASRHFVSFAQAILYRGAGFDVVWPEFAIVAVLGLAFLTYSLYRFRRAIALTR